MATPVSLMDDQMVDMAFITQLERPGQISGFTGSSGMGPFRLPSSWAAAPLAEK